MIDLALFRTAHMFAERLLKNKIVKQSSLTVTYREMSTMKTLFAALVLSMGSLVFAIENNWLDYGACTVNVCDKGKTPIQYLSISNNNFGNNRKHTNCAMIVNDATKADPTNRFDDNKWEDGHTPDPTITRGGDCSK
ncbi:MAG: hypothetical protein P8163_04075 [Candidatus Thiodiazotropha sp.]